MNKKTYYWILGILIALIAVFAVWGLVKSSQPTRQEPSAEPTTEIGTEAGTGNGHRGMDHGMSDSSNAAGDADSLDSGYSRYREDQDAIMGRMLQDMELTEDTGSAALDFIAGMVPHHVAAVEMAESYLEHGGEHKQLKPLAQDIITAQRDEITAMENMYQEIQDSGEKDQEGADAYREAYGKMMQGHHAGHGTDLGQKNSIDAAFAEGMSVHHQMAVDMAEDILKYTDESDILEFAQQIIDTQEEEIKIMQEFLENQ